MIINLQRKVKFEAIRFQPFLAAVSGCVEETDMRHFSVAVVSDRRMKELNRLFRNKEGTTDVLSFPFEADEFDSDTTNLGDIVISAEQAQKQAEENGLSFDLEIKQLILHGVLHLCGYDHEKDDGEMNAREIDLRSKLGIEG